MTIRQWLWRVIRNGEYIKQWLTSSSGGPSSASSADWSSPILLFTHIHCHTYTYMLTHSWGTTYISTNTQWQQIAMMVQKALFCFCSAIHRNDAIKHTFDWIKGCVDLKVDSRHSSGGPSSASSANWSSPILLFTHVRITCILTWYTYILTEYSFYTGYRSEKFECK